MNIDLLPTNSPLIDTNPLNMTVVSNDPTLWPAISYFRELSYFSVASFIVVLYDWVLTFGQEFELIWRQRWSLMTVLYLFVRYVGIPFSLMAVFTKLPSISLTDTGCVILYSMTNWIGIIVNAMLGVIMIVRLQAMYQQSRKMNIFLVVFFLAVQIASVVLNVMQNVGGDLLLYYEFVVSGAHFCGSEQGIEFLVNMTWILGALWEALALFLAVWITVKHFRELPRSSRWAVGDCFTILVRAHIFYFASFAFVSFLHIIYNYTPVSTASEVYGSVIQITRIVQMFVLGPRLILGVREYHAELVAHSDEGTGMGTIVFQERIQITTGGGV